MINLPFRILSTDFDGTLFVEFENPPVPDSLQEFIGSLQEKGVQWIINTGRDLAGLLEVMARARFSIQPDYLVTVEREIYRHMGHRYVGLEAWNARCAAEHARLFAGLRSELPRLIAWVNDHFEATIYEDDFSPFCLTAASNDDADAIVDYMGDFFRHVPDLALVRNDVYARLSHVAYNKGTALAEITRQLGSTAEEVCAAGDHFNDLPMLSADYARWLMAPANAIETVKEAVRQQGGYVSDKPHGHGVVCGLEFYLKNAGAHSMRSSSPGSHLQAPGSSGAVTVELKP